MTEILMTIAVGVIVAIVSNIVSHYLALQREKKRLEHDCNDKDEMETGVSIAD